MQFKTAFKTREFETLARDEARKLFSEYMKRPPHERHGEYYEYAKCWAKISDAEDRKIRGLLKAAELDGSWKNDMALWKELSHVWAANASHLSQDQRKYFHDICEKAQTPEDRWQANKKMIATLVVARETISQDIKGSEYYKYFEGQVKGYIQEGNYSGNEEAWFMVWYVGYQNHMKMLGL